MKLKAIPLLLLLPALMVVLVGCRGDSQPTPEPSPVTAPTPTLVSHTDGFDLTRQISTPLVSSVDAEVGDRVEVAIELHQKYTYDSGIPCAEDGVFLVDTFGNMTELGYKERDGARKQDQQLGTVTTFSYGWAFHPAVDGEYKISIEDSMCRARKEGLSATVHWDIYRQE